MGTESLRDYLRKYRLNLPSQCAQLITNCEAIPLEQFVNEKNEARCCPEAIDLLKKMLVYDKNLRITPRDAMQHAYFDPVRQLTTD